MLRRRQGAPCPSSSCASARLGNGTPPPCGLSRSYLAVRTPRSLRRITAAMRAAAHVPSGPERSRLSVARRRRPLPRSETVSYKRLPLVELDFDLADESGAKQPPSAERMESLDEPESQSLLLWPAPAGRKPYRVSSPTDLSFRSPRASALYGFRGPLPARSALALLSHRKMPGGSPLPAFPQAFSFNSWPFRLFFLCHCGIVNQLGCLSLGQSRSYLDS